MIYCIKHPYLSLYKVGFTCDVGRRMKQYASHGMWVKPLYVKEGGREDELSLHRILEPTRRDGEWFACKRETLDLLF